MPKASLAVPDAQKCLHEAHLRFVRWLSTNRGGPDRLGWLEGRRKRAYASGDAKCCARKCEAGSIGLDPVS